MLAGNACPPLRWSTRDFSHALFCSLLFLPHSSLSYPLTRAPSGAAPGSAETSREAVSGRADDRLWCEWHLDHGSLTGEWGWTPSGRWYAVGAVCRAL